jgi:YHYH protein
VPFALRMKNPFVDAYRGLLALLLTFFVASPTYAQVCAGDCNGDQQVQVDEIVASINISLGAAPLANCGTADQNGDDVVTVDEILVAVNAALSGCPEAAQPTATPALSDDCAAVNFLDVSTAPGAGAGYAAPSLEAECIGDTVVVRSNGIPHYTFVQITPNALVEQSLEYRFPRHPQVATQATNLPLLGAAGVAVNGLPFFGPNEAQRPDPYGDPVVNAILDECLGHTAFVYHYHALTEQCLSPSGLVAEPWLAEAPKGDHASPIVAYAFDGFPVYGPYECADSACTSVVEMQSGWENVGFESVDCVTGSECSNGFACVATIIGGARRNACVPTTYAWNNNVYVEKEGSQYLDQCNGHIGPNGDYHYHATETFPYVIGCYRGTPVSN